MPGWPLQEEVYMLAGDRGSKDPLVPVPVHALAVTAYN